MPRPEYVSELRFRDTSVAAVSSLRRVLRRAASWSVLLLRKLLWVDCGAAFTAGLVVLSLIGWLSDLYALPRGLLVTMGAVNLGYGAFSFSLARRARRPRSLIVVLA